MGVKRLIKKVGRPGSTVYFLVHLVLMIGGITLTLLGGPIWVSIGTSLIATAVVGFVTFIYVAAGEEQRDRARNLEKAGVDRVYTARAAQIRSEYDSRLSSVKSNVDIMGFGLRDFGRDYMDKLAELSHRARVRILLLDPDSPIPGKKDEEEGRSPSQTENDIKEFIRKFDQLYSNNSQLELKVYTCLPTVNVFRIDEELFWGPYLVGSQSANTMTVRVNSDGPIFAQVMQNFENVWESFSRSYTAP
ncbi:hypothetical protein [Rhodococcus sp. 05-340-2]|uniref:hypothetical protein n=1 Tax=Rhodococcus sp. 05-340-2 TaxID=2022504 RepID=UPI00117B0F68|nr:hypothetical protein [Rhodococcus sp. 05-340-2]